MAEPRLDRLDDPVEDGTRRFVRAADGNVPTCASWLAVPLRASWPPTGVCGACKYELVGSPALRESPSRCSAPSTSRAGQAVEVLAVAGAVPLSLVAEVVDVPVLERLERDGLVRLIEDGRTPRSTWPTRCTVRSCARTCPPSLACGSAGCWCRPPARAARSRRLRASDSPTGWLRPARSCWTPACRPSGWRTSRAAVQGDTGLAATLAEAALEIGDSASPPPCWPSWCRGEQGDHDGADDTLPSGGSRPRRN